MNISKFFLTVATAASVALCTAVPAQTVIVDNDDGAPGYVETGDWTTSSSTGYNGGTYRFTDTDREFSTATWTPDIPAEGLYEIYTIFLLSNNRTTDAPYTINHADGTDVVPIDGNGSGVEWVYIGEFRLEAGTGASVTLENSGSPGAYIADAVAFVPAVDDPPSITNMLHLPALPQASDVVTVSATVTDDRGLTLIELEYSASPSGQTDTVPCYDDGAHGDGGADDGVYTAEIPAFPDGEVVSYVIHAMDDNSQATASPAQQYTVGLSTPPEYRSIWADTWNTSFLNTSQADDIVGTCRANNINTIMIEVRKVGDAYYDSSIEPRATNISGGPTFDPLDYILGIAHDTSGGQNRVEIHAWFVMQRIAVGEPTDPQHVLVEHPEYRMLDVSGNIADGSSIYMDPGHPEAVDHNVAVILDCLTNYDIDGINLDYIRYPGTAWGYNQVSIDRFNAIHNRTGVPTTTDSLWRAWRRECVTLQVRKIWVKTQMIDPDIVLTTDTVQWGYSYGDFTSSDAYNGVMQDWVGWLQQGIIDYNALMNYATDNTRYQGWTNLSLASDDIRGSIIGIGAYLQGSVQASMNQLLYARNQGAAGLNIYDWGSEANATSESRVDFYQALRTQVFTEWADPPRPQWKVNPVHGIFEGNITLNGTPVDHATVLVDGMPVSQTVSDGSGWYGLIMIPPGTHDITVTYGALPPKTVTATIPQAGDIITVDIELNQEGAEIPSDLWLTL